MTLSPEMRQAIDDANRAYYEHDEVGFHLARSRMFLASMRDGWNERCPYVLTERAIAELARTPLAAGTTYYATPLVICAACGDGEWGPWGIAQSGQYQGEFLCEPCLDARHARRGDNT